jgi:opacity protein-like surface antigen
MKQDEAKGVSVRVLLATGVFGLVLGALVPASPQNGAAFAQDDGGHEDGDHEDGGGHEGGGGQGQGGEGEGGGHGNGGMHGKPVTPVASPVLQAGEGNTARAGRGLGSPGNYLRLELGAALGSAGDANWLPPGYPADPQVFFDLDMDTSAMAAIGIGHDYGNGWRGEVSLNLFGKTDFDGPWSFTVPDTAGPHADVEGSVRSVALMANGYRDFDSGGKITPFVTVGLGLAQNTMSDWTRINPDAGRTRRSFEGDSDTGLAWSVGAGVSWDVGPVLGSAPAKLDLTWRYFDLGSVTGGTEPLPGSGAGGNPVEALNFDVNDHVIALGLRIPM